MSDRRNSDSNVTLEQVIEMTIRETVDSMREVRVSVPWEDMALVDSNGTPRLAVSDVARIAAEVCRKVAAAQATGADGE